MDPRLLTHRGKNPRWLLSDKSECLGIEAVDETDGPLRKKESRGFIP